MNDANHHACPVEKAGLLDNAFRRWFQNPRRILKPYIREGTTVLDMGCGPGFFSIDMAEMVGKSGRVIASDLQAGMLQKLKDKIGGTELEGRISLHQCQTDKIGLLEKVDFILAAWMVHEVPDQDRFFRELSSLLKSNGQILILEPPFHVSQSEFEEMLGIAQTTGLIPSEQSQGLLGRKVILKKSQS